MVRLAFCVLLFASGCLTAPTAIPAPQRNSNPRTVEEAVALCGGDLPPELQSKIDPELPHICVDWARRGETETAPSIRVLIELKSKDPTELERAGVPFSPLYGRIFAAQLPADAIVRVARLHDVVHIHFERPTEPGLAN